MYYIIQKALDEIMDLAPMSRRDLEAWMEEKEEDEKWEERENEYLAAEHEYAEYMNDAYCWSVIELMFSLRNLDLAERHGYMSKFRKS